MEVFAIGLLGLAGKYISDRFKNNTDDEYIENTEEKNDEDTYATTVNSFDQKKRVQETMDSVALEKKVLSDDPHNKNIIPPLFNKRVYSLDTENKYLSASIILATEYIAVLKKNPLLLANLQFIIKT